MSDESGAKDAGAVWREQPEEKFAVTLEHFVNRRTRELYSSTRSEIVMNRLQQLGVAVVVAWVLVSLYRFRDRIWRTKAPRMDAAAATGLDYYRKELERRRDHLRNAWLWHGPLFLACMIFVVTFAGKAFPGAERLGEFGEFGDRLHDPQLAHGEQPGRSWCLRTRAQPQMNTPTIARPNAAAYVVLVLLFCFVALFQWRASLETVHLQRTLDFYVPFTLQPFTNRITERDHTPSWELGRDFDVNHYSVLYRGDEVLSVNARPFRGMSVYLQELWKAQRQPPPPPQFEWHPFTVTVRSGDQRIHRIEVGFPHCTCGIPSRFEAATLWIAPPMFCLLLGFATVALRPRAMLSWAFLGLMLSLSQLQLWHESYTGFQVTANPMRWTGWLRVPAVGYRSFVQHAWPSALLVFSAHFFPARRSIRRVAVALAIAFAAFAVLEATLQIAWSENYGAFASLYRLLESHSTACRFLALASVAALAWLFKRGYGLAVSGIALFAAVGLLWSPPAITHGLWQLYSDKTWEFDPVVPKFHNTPELIVLVFAAACVLAALAAFRREVARGEMAAFVLLIPGAVDMAGSFGAYWYPLGPGTFGYWWWLVFALAAAGLTAIAWSVLRRTSPQAT